MQAIAMKTTPIMAQVRDFRDIHESPCVSHRENLLSRAIYKDSSTNFHLDQLMTMHVFRESHCAS